PPSARRRIGFSEIPRKVRGIVFANVLGAVGFGYLFVFIAAYLPQIGIGAEVVGLLFGAQGVAIVLSAIPLGIYSDRRGRKWLLLIASVILPPSVLVFAFTTDLWWLVPAAVVAGIGEGAFLSTWNAIIADQTTVEQRNAAFSLSFILNNVAGARASLCLWRSPPSRPRPGSTATRSTSAPSSSRTRSGSSCRLPSTFSSAATGSPCALARRGRRRWTGDPS